MQCNMCEAKGGENINHPSEEGLTKHNGHLSEINFQGHYLSTHLMDYRKYSIYLCEACIRNLMDNCKIPPKMLSHVGNGEFEPTNASYEEDQKIMHDSGWRHSKEYHDAYLNKKCNYSINCPNEAMYSYYLEAIEPEEGFPGLEAEPTDQCFCEGCLIKMKQDVEDYNFKSNNPKDKLDFSNIVKYIDPSLWNFK